MSPSAGANEFPIHFALGTIGAYLISSKGLIIRRESMDWLGEHSMNLLDLVYIILDKFKVCPNDWL